MPNLNSKKQLLYCYSCKKNQIHNPNTNHSDIFERDWCCPVCNSVRKLVSERIKLAREGSLINHQSKDHEVQLRRLKINIAGSILLAEHSGSMIREWRHGLGLSYKEVSLGAGFSSSATLASLEKKYSGGLCGTLKKVVNGMVSILDEKTKPRTIKEYSAASSLILSKVK